MMIDKPLFSRKQLNILICVIAVAIVLLSATGKQPSLPQTHIEPLADTRIYWQEIEQPTQHIRLSFALPANIPADSFTSQLTRQLLIAQLNRQQPPRSAGGSRLQVGAHPDRIVVELHAAATADAIALLSTLIKVLQNSKDAEQWQQTAGRLRAERYLDRQQLSAAEHWLSAQLNPAAANQLDVADHRSWQAFRAQLFSRAQLHVSLLSDTPDPLLEALAGELTKLPEGRPWDTGTVSPAAPRQHSFQHSRVPQQAYIVQLARILPGRTADNFPTTRAAIALIRSASQQLGIAADWRAAGDYSELHLRASSQQAITANQLVDRLQQHIRKLSDSELESSLDKLIEQLRQSPETTAQKLQQLDTLAFYQLPADHLPQLVSTLEHLNTDTLRQATLDILAAEDFHQALEHP